VQGAGDDKHDKSRLHLDLRIAGPETEAGRIAGLGPSLLTDHPVIGHRWRRRILADPDGNEYCVSCSHRSTAPHELISRPVGGMTDVDAALSRGSPSRPPNDDPDSGGMPEQRPGRGAGC
jgi:Glyoxalase-like domain